MFGIDISNNNAIEGAIEAIHASDFCIMKLTEGIGYDDKMASRFYQECKDHEVLTGFYHYAKNTQSTEMMYREAQHFIRRYKEICPSYDSIAMLDWEEGTVDNIGAANTFMENVEKQLGIKCLLYTYDSLYVQFFQYVERVWVASWGNNRIFTIEEGKNFSQYLEQFKNKPEGVLGIQFTSRGRVKNQYIDFNKSRLTREEWRKMTRVLYTEMKISTAEQWAIDIGIIKGFGNGEYKWSLPITRSELATILKRYDDYCRSK